MSSLWTPGGEHPVDRSTPTPPSDAPPAGDPSLDDEIAAALPEGVTLDDLSPEERARAEEMIREMAEARGRLLETPAAMIVANHGMGLYELAALHLSQETPNFTEATVAIDALAAIIEKLEGRLGEAEATLTEALDQLRMVFVQLKNQGAPSES
ncbi:MAG: DUF1844 domain-containing protein [Acidimicrobiales bacterium]|nr:DUF1844 domain-containing protein [Acidimicrobiales bacterium]